VKQLIINFSLEDAEHPRRLHCEDCLSAAKRTIRLRAPRIGSIDLDVQDRTSSESLGARRSGTGSAVPLATVQVERGQG